MNATDYDPKRLHETTLVVHPDPDGGFVAKLYAYRTDGKRHLHATWYIHEFRYLDQVGCPYTPLVLEEP